MKKDDLIVVRGGGDLATGTIYALWRSGYSVLVLECMQPTAIRRQVSVCEAIYDGETVVEDMRAVRIETVQERQRIWQEGAVPVLADPEGESIRALKPAVVIDAMIAKKNLGTTIDMAPLTIALGPGFTAGLDVHYVIETKRGHDLGRIISQGRAVENTGIPGNIGGYSAERVIHSPAQGILKNVRRIGDVVEQGETIAYLETEDGAMKIPAAIPGVIRGLIRDSFPVTKGFKIADIDPRLQELKNCFTISDKARCIAGGVLTVVTREFLLEKTKRV